MAYNHDLQGWRHFIQSTLVNRLGEFANHPRHIENETPRRPLPHYGKSARRSFSNGALFLALLCKPPLERITSHFVILPRQIAFFWLMYIPLIYRKAKKIGKYLTCPLYILSAFFSFWGDLGALVGALVVLFLLVAGHQLGTYPRWYRNAPER